MDERDAMREAAVVVVETAEALAQKNSNVVAEVMHGQDEFREWDHYPKGDVYDKASSAQYYYHSHNGAADEHGHFHTFLRNGPDKGGVTGGGAPVQHSGSNAEDWPEGDEIITHFVAISMDHHGIPTHLFTTNRWVTGETVYAAADMIAMLDSFRIDQSIGEWQAANRWVTAMMCLFRPQIEQLLILRDDAVTARRSQMAGSELDVYEDKAVELTSICEISVLDQLEWLEMLE